MSARRYHCEVVFEFSIVCVLLCFSSRAAKRVCSYLCIMCFCSRAAKIVHACFCFCNNSLLD